MLLGKVLASHIQFVSKYFLSVARNMADVFVGQDGKNQANSLAPQSNIFMLVSSVSSTYSIIGLHQFYVLFHPS